MLLLLLLLRLLLLLLLLLKRIGRNGIDEDAALMRVQKMVAWRRGERMKAATNNAERNSAASGRNSAAATADHAAATDHAAAADHAAANSHPHHPVRQDFAGAEVVKVVRLLLMQVTSRQMVRLLLRRRRLMCLMRQ